MNMENEKSKIVNILRSALNIEKCGNHLMFNKAISLFENNKAIAKEVAQIALAEVISSAHRDVLLRSLSNDENTLCLALVDEWNEQQLKAKKAWDTYVEPKTATR
jgi:hypothetical protein